MNTTREGLDGSCRIIWSTQSGRAKACARRTARILRSHIEVHGRSEGSRESYGCAFDRLSTDEFLGMKDTPLVVLFVSTTGDGQPCDDLRDTWTALLKKSLSPTTLSTMIFALFCLGDRAYGPLFCAAGRKLAARLVQLGAQTFCDIGYGDDGSPNGGVFADLDVWLEETLLPKVRERGWVDERKVDIDISPQVPCPFCVSFDNQDCENSAERSQQLEEWEHEMYAVHYMPFFSATCRPSTAYKYDAGAAGTKMDSSQVTDATSPLVGQVISNTRITASNWEQDTRHMTVRIDRTVSNHGEASNSNNLPYRAGDVATIIPSNTEEEVRKFLGVLPSSMRSVADAPMTIYYDELDTDTYAPWPKRCTLRGLLTHCADIHGLPEREDLRELSLSCHSCHPMGKDQREKLNFLSETSGSALYADYILREKRGWSDVLYDFDSTRWTNEDSTMQQEPKNYLPLTVERLLCILHPIRPRHFSIASSPSAGLLSDGLNDGFEIDLCVARVQGTTPLGRKYHGLCSNYLAERNPCKSAQRGAVRLWIRPGSFEGLPVARHATSSGHGRFFERPIMMIGAGTGIAPLRSLLLEREAIRKMATRNSDAGADSPIPISSDTTDENDVDHILIFGCRKESADFYYKEEWSMLSRPPNPRLRLLTAFSRDQWHKIYVQQVLEKADSGTLVAKHIVERGGAVYVGGGAKMARAVKDEILKGLAEYVGKQTNEAAVILKRLQRVGLYSVESWS